MTRAMGSLRVRKQTGTHGDVFAAAGLADLLRALDGGVRIRDLGTEFEVRTSRGFEETEIERIPQAPGYPFLKPNENVRVPRGAQDVVDYKAEKAKADRRRQAARAQRTRRGEDGETRAQMQEEEVREDWRLLQVLNTLQGDETSNSVHRTIVELKPSTFRDDVAAGLARLAGDAAAADIEWKVSTVQLFTPTAAKGYSRLKPDGTDRNDKTKEQWADPFVEWLRYRGYFRVACPFFQGPKAEHVRLLCPVPADISIGALGFVARQLRKEGVYGGPPKMDALAVLRLAELLIRHSEEYHDEGAEVAPGLFLEGKHPADAVSGIMVTHYQSLGNAKAVSAMSTLALPSWFPVATREDARLWVAILDEHQRVVRGLRDDHSDEIGLLIAYRRFLESRGDGAVWALLTFLEGYGPFLIRAREQRRRVRSFRADHLRRVLMGSAGEDTSMMVTPILDDPGFQAVAAAVRRATVSAQGQKAMGVPDYREIRYDLLPELRRKRSIPGVAPLMEAVADFVSRYNAENARRREMGKAAPRNVTTEEFSTFAALVERHRAPLVGALLCAFGSCREAREGGMEQHGRDDSGAEESRAGSQE